MKQKRGEGKQTLKRGGKLGQGVGALKRGGEWNPLTNYGNFKSQHLHSAQHKNMHSNLTKLFNHRKESINLAYIFHF